MISGRLLNLSVPWFYNPLCGHSKSYFSWFMCDVIVIIIINYLENACHDLSVSFLPSPAQQLSLICCLRTGLPRSYHNMFSGSKILAVPRRIIQIYFSEGKKPWLFPYITTFALKNINNVRALIQHFANSNYFYSKVMRKWKVSSISLSTFFTLAICNVWIFTADKILTDFIYLYFVWPSTVPNTS